ncbi:signal transduction histidine kinase [Solidesulfovibrio fructosivorans JJ]]|uniref:histidine kinase n=1 Tax=Solidesulfovibrio fructosivorans JJ] TaxID=596151 RepID=E1JZR5_SOLFR|nr:histidine kinase dimerization/phosphoacceptor domain -containing protein [Solidesulfovibrio fructosivorans]EFL50200.1 signal transduction histidine kinase [Solidesulfovibrio fructosivorans JJ]]
MKIRWTLSIRGGLVLLALLAVLPALALQVYDGVLQRRHLIDDATMESRRSAASFAQVQASITDSTRLLLTTLAAMPEVRRLDTAACDALFASLLRQNPIYINILVTNRQGDIVASGLPYGRVNLADRKHFRDAMATGRFSAGEYIVSRTGFDPAFPFALPFRDNAGNTAGVLIAAVKLASYDRAFDKLLLPPGSMLGITDNKGVRLYYRPKTTTNPLGRPIKAEVWRRVAEGGEEGAFPQTGTDGRHRFFAYQKLSLEPGQAPYMTFVVGLPASVVLAPARKALATNLILLAATAFLALGVAWFFGGAVIARRLDRVAATADRIGRGDLTARTGLPYGAGGIGKVAKTLDSMAELLARHETARENALAALRRNQERMAHIAASMADWIWETDADARFVYVSARVRQAMGYDPEALLGKSFFDFLAPGEEARVRPVFEAARETGEPLRECVNWRVARDGLRRCISTSGVPWHDESGVFKGYRGVDRDVTARMQAEQELRESLDEKDTLLKEIHHRVKNNLQIISGLLYLQEEQVHDPTALESFRESRNRIASMALVHEELYRATSLSRIRLDDYIRELLPRLFGHDQKTPRLSFDCRLDPVGVPIEKAVPAGLALNELFTNAYKHGFAGRETGLLLVELREEEKDVVIKVRDDGPGLPEGFDPDAGATLGMQLIANLSRQLGGTVEAGNDGGAVFTLRFPK